MNSVKIAGELLRVAKGLIAGDEWIDENTFKFAKEVANEMRRARVKVTRVNKNIIDFVYAPTIISSVPLRLTLMEFGYEVSESVNGTITSLENASFTIPGGYTSTRNPRELWNRAEEMLEDIFSRAMGDKV